MNKEIIKTGLIISKTFLFRYLLIQAGGFLRDPGRLLDLANRAFQRIRSYKKIGNLTSDAENGFKQLCRMTLAYAKGQYDGLSRKQIALIIGTLLYFMTPVDIIPDTIPFLGLLDDLSLIAWLISTIKNEVEAFLTWEKRSE